jgi:hypothetical protein
MNVQKPAKAIWTGNVILPRPDGIFFRFHICKIIHNKALWSRKKSFFSEKRLYLQFFLHKKTSPLPKEGRGWHFV